jgi:prefoldin subunit 5
LLGVALAIVDVIRYDGRVTMDIDVILNSLVELRGEIETLKDEHEGEVDNTRAELEELETEDDRDEDGIIGKQSEITTLEDQIEHLEGALSSMDSLIDNLNNYKK